LKDVFFCELVLSDMQKILQLGWVDLFVFSCNEERGNTQHVKLALLDVNQGKVAVDYRHCHIEGLGQKSELASDIDNPFY
jgi:hypothetical protein